jgi:phenylacetate-CoA ligase
MIHQTTRPEEERRAQSAWRLRRPEVAPVIERLIDREFLTPEEGLSLERRDLGRILAFARSEVPYYRRQSELAGLDLSGPVDREALLSLPVLTKNDVQDHTDDLRAERLPAGEAIAGWASSSGTTGRPTLVLRNQSVAAIFGLLVQRPLRWGRLDPNWTQAVIRLQKDLPRQPDGQPLQDGAMIRAPSWQYLGNWFHTGPMLGINRSNPVEVQIEFLRRNSPEYLVTFPGTLETLVLACQGSPVDSLRATRTISATLTMGMRKRIEDATGLPIHEGYGLNEVGIVAGRCSEGRYHVHAEHCLVELVDEDGSPTPPGQIGSVLVTSLTNYAMPLIRYETGDLAVSVEGPCPCGLTLPSIGRIVGRYRAMRHAPQGTSRRVNLVIDTIDALPLASLAGLRAYQLHQFTDDRFELRLETVGEPSPAIVDAVRRAWDAENDASHPLTIIRVEQIPGGPGGKQQEFTSDFFPSVHEGTELGSE